VLVESLSQIYFYLSFRLDKCSSRGSKGSNTFPSESDNNWLNDDEVVNCTILESALRETLRLYSPIHIGRLSLEEITLKTNKGQIVTIPKGTDLFCNMWFIYRNESTFFLKKIALFLALVLLIFIPTF